MIQLELELLERFNFIIIQQIYFVIYLCIIDASMLRVWTNLKAEDVF